jgi:hypothetical protein
MDHRNRSPGSTTKQSGKLRFPAEWEDDAARAALGDVAVLRD